MANGKTGSENRMEQQTGTASWLGMVLWVTLVVLVLGSALIVSGVGWAQSSDSSVTAGFQSGEVTDKQGRTIYINGQGYSLSSEAIIKDDEGRTKGEKDLVPGTMVKFHLSRGSADQIDQIVIILPR